MSQSIHHRLLHLFTKAAHTAFETFADVPLEVAKSQDPKFGQYQFNSAMKLGQYFRQNPRKIAEAIVAAMEPDEAVEKLEIAGPGFINIWLKKEFLQNALSRQLNDPKLLAHAESPQRIIIDFSSPNIAKQMHVGHLRTTIIGESLARVFEFLGHDVLRLNHVGDWGTSFGMLIAYMKENNTVSQEALEKVTLDELMAFYKASKVKFDADEGFKKRAQLEVVALQNGNEEAIRIWKAICETSRKAFQEIYDLLGITVTERGESFYNPWLAKVISDCEQKGLVTVSDGAKCIFMEGFVNREGEPLPLMIQKSDGGYNYDTTDMAALYHRVQIEKAERVIYVVDCGQSEHFDMIFEAGRLAGYWDPKNVRLDHVPFGLVLGADGKKFRTRSGETEMLIDLLDSAIDKAYDIVKQRNPEWSDKEQKQLASCLGIGAIKYADLATSRTSDYSFSYEKMLRFEGNTVAFVMYAYVRCLGIQRKIGVDVSTIEQKIDLTHPSEVQLALHLLRFPEMIDQLADDLYPHRLAEYLYILAETFNAFFRDCRVEGVPEQNSRLLLVHTTERVLRQGLQLLGINTVDKM